MYFKYKKNFLEMFNSLWKLNRSLTGHSVRITHKKIKKKIKLKTYEIKTGTQINDWSVPKEWNVNDAYIIDPYGKKICNFKLNNLHLASYSNSINKQMSLKNLKKHLHYIKEQPNLIPYKTLYYKNTWGFCISYNQFRKLKDGIYHIKIDCKKTNGSMTISDCIIPGKIKKEILIHSYTCHPSMAYNELCGPIFSTLLASKLTTLKNYFTYRFIFCPETLGANAYLAKNHKILKKHLLGGLVCNCIGVKNYITYYKPKNTKSILDYYLIKKLKKLKNKKIKIKNFNPSGSDERQYCSLGYNLPVGSLMSIDPQDYNLYHTSGDTLKTVSIKSLYELQDMLIKIFKEIEKDYFKHKGFYKVNKKFGEPKFSKYNLNYNNKLNKYPDELTKSYKWLVHFLDGETSLKEISDMSKINLKILEKAAKDLLKSKIITN